MGSGSQTNPILQDKAAHISQEMRVICCAWFARQSSHNERAISKFLITHKEPIRKLAGGTISSGDGGQENSVPIAFYVNPSAMDS